MRDNELKASLGGQAMRGDWFNAFRKAHNLEFTDEDYSAWAEMVKQSLPIYIRHLPEGATVLECCCGLGCTAVPLSHYYNVTAFDKDERVLEYTRRNARRYGEDIEVVNADFREIDKIFGRDSFDACSSGGVLEHYPVNEVRELVDKQLVVAPIVFISIPLGDGEKTVDDFQITRYNYSEDQWLREILTDYNIVEKSVMNSHPKVFGGLECKELFMVLRRNESQ